MVVGIGFGGYCLWKANQISKRKSKAMDEIAG